MRETRQVQTLLAVLVISAGVVSSTVSSQAREGGNWPQWRGPQRDGISTETGLGAGFSSVAVIGGRIFTMGDRRDGQYVIALTEDAGKEVWATRIGGRHDDEYGGPRSTPTIDGDRLYVVDTDGDVVCLDVATGHERWRRSMPREFRGRMMSTWMFSESPLVDGDRVVVTPGSDDAAMVALDKMTGKDIWRARVRDVNGAGYSSIVISNGAGVKQYVQLMGRGLVSIRASDGWYMWSQDSVANNIANIATPIIKDDYVFASTSYNTGSVLVQLSKDASGRVNATEKYFLEGRTLQNHHGGFVLIDGVLYGGHGQSNGFPVALDLMSGKMLWNNVRGAGTGSAAVTAADGRLYFRYQDGTMALIAANPKQYQLISSFAIPNVRNPSWSHPVVTGGRLYLREQDALHVYSIRK